MRKFKLSSKCGAHGVAVALLVIVSIAVPAVAAGAQPDPNEPLTAGWLYAPKFTTPSSNQKFNLAPGLKVVLKVEIPIWQSSGGGKFDFVQHAKASPFTEKWHIRIERLLNQNLDKEVVQEFEGPVSGYQYSTVLDYEWFKKHGAGRYGAFSYLGQLGPGGEVTGLATGVGFDIVVPMLKMSDQKQSGDNVAQTQPSGSAWSALARPKTVPAGPPSLPPTPPPLANSQRLPLSALGAGVAPAPLDATTERALSAASCARVPGVGGLRFSCANRAGFDRCEALRRQNKVEQCALSTGR